MRQYISDQMPDNDGKLEIVGKGFRHLKNVLRIKTGDVISVRLPDGALRDMRVCKIEPNHKVVVTKICDSFESISSKGASMTSSTCLLQNADVFACPSLDLWLFMFIAKPKKMELVIRQATECGVTKIVPVIGKYSQAGNVTAFKTRASSARFMRIVREAREQSGSAVATEITEAMSVGKAAKMWQLHSSGEKFSKEREEFPTGENDLKTQVNPTSSCAIVLYEKNHNTRRLHEVVIPKIKKAAVAVGCEGGISLDEIEILCKAGFVPVHFATNILRCETAALYGIAAMQSAMTEAIYGV